MFKLIADRVKKIFERQVTNGVDGVARLFSGHEQLTDDEKHVIALIKSLLPEDPVEKERSIQRFRTSLERQDLDERKISKLLIFLRKVAPGSAEKALPALKKSDPLQQKMILSNLLALIIEHGQYREDDYGILKGLADELGISENDFSELSEAVINAWDARGKIIRSGTGIILALVVIGLFVLIATWLSSLLFGLVLAYIFLPLEQYFERQLRKEPGRVTRCLRKLNFLKLIRDKLVRKSEFELSAEEIEMRKRQAITTQATTLTVSCVVVSGIALLVLICVLLLSYFSALRKDFAQTKNRTARRTLAVAVVQTPCAAPGNDSAVASVGNGDKVVGGSSIKCSEDVAKNDQAPKTANKPEVRSRVFTSISNNLVGMLDRLKQRFESLPLVQRIINQLSDYLAGGKAEEQLAGLVLKNSGGIFSFVGKFITFFASFLLNLLLTFFFFSLFLSKLALFTNSSQDKKQRPSSYLIRTVFNGKWLPLMSEENLREGDRIVGEVVNKLRIWLRGYMTMIAIDYCVYTTVFVLLDIPYAPILGAVAAVGILLPYIGPVSSALLTVLVTLAVGGSDVTVMQIAGAIGVYLIHNGIIEQFFIYPWIIGESLGLSTLETIIVVLLGGILAGIPGMIFALPAASVIKYLVPQIYRCWR